MKSLKSLLKGDLSKGKRYRRRLIHPEVEGDTMFFLVKSSSTPGVIYKGFLNAKGEAFCSCPARKKCQHIKRAIRYWLRNRIYKQIKERSPNK